MDLNKLTQEIGLFQQRLYNLYDVANSVPSFPTALIPETCKELGLASEELSVAIEELLMARDREEFKSRVYLELFESFPNPCFITNENGIILEANSKATSLLEISKKILIRKPLSVFITPSNISTFHSLLAKIETTGEIQTWNSFIQPRCSHPKQVVFKVIPIINFEGLLEKLHWFIQEIPLPPSYSPVVTPQKHSLLNQNAISLTYLKGETIPVESDIVWFVSSGIIKLTTMGEKGETCILGFVFPSMTFGADFTSLSIYSATPLSQEVQVIRLSLAEITASQEKSRIFLSSVIKRLQDTEQLLAIASKRQAKHRVEAFLWWLKEEVGESIDSGIRLPMRLTHSEIAEACGTTRVTVTRELGKLQQAGKIFLDADSCIVLQKNK